jgi:hypothetical protein
VFPITTENKEEQENIQIDMLKNKYQVDVIVLARYMQVLSHNFLNAFSNGGRNDMLINIHHSFLPAFMGERPYHKAHERGVKLIGATAHYVTDKLDEGPIIDQVRILVAILFILFIDAIVSISYLCLLNNNNFLSKTFFTKGCHSCITSRWCQGSCSERKNHRKKCFVECTGSTFGQSSYSSQKQMCSL